MLGELQFLARYPWLYVEHAEHHEGQWHYRANYASGTSYPFRQHTWETPLGINSRRCLLVDEAKPAVLELDPFVIVTSEGRLQQPDIFFFDGMFSSGRANFMSYHVGDYIDPTDEGSPASVASDAVNSLLKLLKNRIPLADEVLAVVPEKPTSEDYHRLLTHCPVMRGHQQLFKAFYDAGDQWVTTEDLFEAMGRTWEDIRGILGALGKRVNQTPGYGQAKKPGIKMLLSVKTVGGSRHYRLLPEMRAAPQALNPDWLHKMTP